VTAYRSNPGRPYVHSYLAHGDDAIPLEYPVGLHPRAMGGKERTSEAA